ncbi:hypothetical protein ACFV6E_24240 [Streptomyces sp. NPDC059785]|uniref:hypothetical protein n=1 Tax=unclassified Streptomyces TaxID=2593676 RepID=UPI003662A007
MSETVHESYSFACMRCGHGWEQSYEIEHHLDHEGTAYVTYLANGHAVPSPLSSPTCQNCDNHVVRIMRAGQVSSALNSMHRPGAVPRQPAADAPHEAPEPAQDHHWHLSDLLHPFQHRKAG